MENCKLVSNGFTTRLGRKFLQYTWNQWTEPLKTLKTEKYAKYFLLIKTKNFTKELACGVNASQEFSLLSQNYAWRSFIENSIFSSENYENFVFMKMGNEFSKFLASFSGASSKDHQCLNFRDFMQIPRNM